MTAPTERPAPRGVPVTDEMVEVFLRARHAHADPAVVDAIVDHYRHAVAWGRVGAGLDAVGPLVAAQVRAEFAAAGRLLPEGGKTEFQWAVRWYLPDGSHDDQDCRDVWGRETAEQRTRRLAANPPNGAIRGEVWQRVITTGPWQHIDTEGGEKP